MIEILNICLVTVAVAVTLAGLAILTHIIYSIIKDIKNV